MTVPHPDPPHVDASTEDQRGIDNGSAEPASRSVLVDARLKPRRARRAAGLSCAGLLALVLSGGGGLALGHVFLRPSAPTPTEPAAPHGHDQRLVGRWLAKDGTRVLISKSGAIWADNGNLLGEGIVDEADGSRLTFQGPGFRCVYTVTFKDDSFTWQVLDQTAGTPCPAGKFVKPFTF